MGARLDDEIRPDLVNDLLVDEKVGRVLEHLHAQPVHPQLLVKHIIEVQTVEILHDLIPAGNQVASFPPRVLKEGQPSQQSAEHRVLAGPAQVEYRLCQGSIAAIISRYDCALRSASERMGAEKGQGIPSSGSSHWHATSSSGS
jgi:hypothetical protein